MRISCLPQGFVPVTVVRSLSSGHVSAAVGALQESPPETLLGARRTRERDLMGRADRVTGPLPCLETCLGRRSSGGGPGAVRRVVELPSRPFGEDPEQGAHPPDGRRLSATGFPVDACEPGYPCQEPGPVGRSPGSPGVLPPDPATPLQKKRVDLLGRTPTCSRKREL